jgi:hypothetical protein
MILRTQIWSSIGHNGRVMQPFADRHGGCPILEGPRITWIVGAGFSKSLGAPLLADLFTPRSLRRIASHYSGPKYERLNHAGLVVRLFNRGKDESAGAQWSDAEEFIGRLDLATRSDSERAALQAIVYPLHGAV